jgi:hypothetical protein
MATLKIKGSATANINGSKKTFAPVKNVTINEAVDMEVNLAHGDVPSTLIDVTPAAKGGSNAMNDFKYLGIQNIGAVPAEIMIEATQYYDNSNVDESISDASNFVREAFLSFIIPAGDHMVLPNPRIVIYNEASTGSPQSAANAAALNTVDSAFSVNGNVEGPTDGNGAFTSTDHFGETVTGGAVPGSYVINFYAAGYQELGITNSTNKGAVVDSTTDSDLAANTAYAFNIQVDGASAETIAFTTHTSDVTLGDPADSSSTGVLRKIQEALNANSNTRGVIVSIIDGDVRFTSRTRLSTSAIALAAPSSGTTMFGVGIIPAIGNIDGAVAAALESTSTPDYLKIGVSGNTDHLMLDKGNGHMSRVNGGSATIDYDAAGHVILSGCPPHASFKIHCIINSAHSGELSNASAATANCIKKIYGRSCSRGSETKLQITAFN